MTLPLANALSQCQRHAGVLAGAMARMPRSFTVAEVQSADEELVRTTDQFALRFIALQDTLGEHVLRPSAAEVLGEPVADLPLIDVLDGLERLGSLSTSGWLRWRALRNSLTHECPGHPHIRAALLNEARGAAERMIDLLRRLRGRAAR